ncbi:MAG: desulfoferrodoxin [Erysipelotrichaceae bacterium]|jgi:superoxide reductase|nr:desulfoferrodoxin [Erysipelotrichaceae bacterium]
MSNHEKFYRCPICGNFFGVINDAGPIPVCCGEPMKVVEANSTDAATEKHVPDVELNGNVLHVKVGSIPHPMLPEHYIQWVFVITNLGRHRMILAPGEAPEANVLLLPEEKPLRVYEYCNLHGLWVKEL